MTLGPPHPCWFGLVLLLFSPERRNCSGPLHGDAPPCSSCPDHDALAVMQDTDTTVWHSRNSRRQIVIQNKTALGCGRACTFFYFFLQDMPYFCKPLNCFICWQTYLRGCCLNSPGRLHPCDTSVGQCSWGQQGLGWGSQSPRPPVKLCLLILFAFPYNN